MAWSCIYHFSGRAIYKGLQGRFKNGEKICILGETGCGKTTLVNIILGLYPIESGTVTYYYQGKQVYGRPNISYLVQDGYLFDTSIRENIRIGNPDIREDVYNKIVGICMLDNTIKAHGENPIGDDGCNLSGGEKKRIRLAQMLANTNADIYVFDELTGSLDEETYTKILSNVFEVLEDKLCIFIEHNRKVADRMDHVYKLSDGTLQEVINQR